MSVSQGITKYCYSQPFNTSISRKGIVFPLTGNSPVTINSSAFHKQENKIAFPLSGNPPVAIDPHAVHTQLS